MRIDIIDDDIMSSRDTRVTVLRERWGQVVPAGADPPQVAAAAAQIQARLSMHPNGQKNPTGSRVQQRRIRDLACRRIFCSPPPLLTGVLYRSAPAA